MTPEQAEAVLKMCRKIQHACPWARIIDEESDPIGAFMASRGL